MSGPGPDELARTLASITGQKLPPNPDAPHVAKLLQGALASIAMQAARQPGNTPELNRVLPLKVREVLIPTDRDGNYEDYIIVITDSGIRIKVTVEPEDA